MRHGERDDGWRGVAPKLALPGSGKLATFLAESKRQAAGRRRKATWRSDARRRKPGLPSRSPPPSS
eukprot:813978-Pyramimonas_sp.AAC.1